MDVSLTAIRQTGSCRSQPARRRVRELMIELRNASSVRTRYPRHFRCGISHDDAGYCYMGSGERIRRTQFAEISTKQRRAHDHHGDKKAFRRIYRGEGWFAPFRDLLSGSLGNKLEHHLLVDRSPAQARGGLWLSIAQCTACFRHPN